MNEKQFKPMLAPNQSIELDTIKFPICASTKLDGIRCIFKDGEMLSRSLKPLRNIKLQERFEHMKQLSKDTGIIFDGEIYSHELNFQEITHFVMKEDIEDEILPEHLHFWCFDALDNESDNECPFPERVALYYDYVSELPHCTAVEQKIVNSVDEIEKLFGENIERGFEGLILKSIDGRYKFGRGTIKEGLMYKMKPFQTYDLEVIEVLERMENTTESHTNELGRAEKSRYKDNMVPTGIAGAFLVKWKGQDMKVTLTGDEEFRRDIWNFRKDAIGKIIEFKAMEVGSKDVLRHPTFIRFREDK